MKLYLGELLDQTCKKHILIKKNHIAYFLCQFVLFSLAAVGKAKVFFAILSFARMAKNRFAPHDSVAPPSPIVQCSTKNEFLHLYRCSSINFLSRNGNPEGGSVRRGERAAVWVV